MNHVERTHFKLALMKLIDEHQEEFEQQSKQSVFQVNQVGHDKVQVLFSEMDGVEITLRPITETEIKVR